MRIGILHGYDPRNTGDAEITLAMIRMAQRIHPEASITLETRYFAEARRFFARHAPDITVVGTQLPFPPPGRRSWSGLSAALKARPSTRNYDLALLMGGGYLYSNPGRRIPSPTIGHLLLEVLRLRISLPHARITSGPISVGPVTRLDRPLVAALLRTLDDIIVRDGASLDLVSRMGYSATQAPDIALTSASFTDDGSAVLQSPSTLAVNVMDWRWAGASRADWAAYEKFIRELISDAQGLGLNVIGFGMSAVPEQGQVDTDTWRAIAGPEAESVQGYDDIHALLSDRPYVVSTRLHGALMAMARGAPTLHLSYQPKGIGTFRLLGRRQQAIDVRDLKAFSSQELLTRLFDVDPGTQSNDVRNAASKTTDVLTSLWGQLGA